MRGKIALVRYSVPYSYRGFKALTAQQRGAAGLLIYSDPADDGAAKGKVYPGRPWYRHLIYAPRFTYAPEVLPGVSEAIEAGDGGRARAQARRLADALRRAAAALDRLN